MEISQNCCLRLLVEKNELLTETIVCCLLMFMHSSFFFEKCHVLYGMNIILDVASDLLNQKNWKLLLLNF
ncbi:hypothetical protein CEXT_768491 [Caerostris extrusa]|uniref:Uncharacterized protein n=1 Tax=Caerostris extrusa TaxID=172846 RepID=A0AAV4XMM1_CAEEX|nr:hypothetical protein CEXT_768491 [Caerostris extrusa]